METPDPPFMTPRFQGLKTGGLGVDTPADIWRIP